MLRSIFIFLFLFWGLSAVAQDQLADSMIIDGQPIPTLDNQVTLDSLPSSLSIVDTLVQKSTEVDSFLWEYQVRKNSKRAGLYSALVPGLGQAYNKQYWKIGLVYAAIGTSSGFIIYNYSEYNATRKEIADRNLYGRRINPKYNLLNDNVLLLQEDYYKNNLDISVLLTGVGYLLQIIEAISANHLKDFDLSPDISLKFKTSPLPHHQIGVGVAFNLK